MNWLDIILIICIIIEIVFMTVSIIEQEYEFSLLILILIGVNILPFIVLDRGSGSTLGIITSVDKNFFGTTALYIKTSETEQEKYCIEFNSELEEQAKELIGEKVKVSYGKRVGLYSTGKCHQAPIQKIELIEK